MIPPTSTMPANEGHGERLRIAREAAGLSVDQVAQRLKMPLRTVIALEADDWQRLGAPVFVRGQLRSYAKLLGLPASAFESVVGPAQIQPTALVPRTRTPRLQRIADQVGGRLVYIVITALIVLPVWVATQSHLGTPEDAAPLDLPGNRIATTAPATPAARPVPATVVASMASLPARQPDAPALSIAFSGDSWVRVIAPDGSTIEQALLKAGETRSYASGQVGRLVLGNATSVEVKRDGALQDITPFMRANVARFAVSSDGSLAPTTAN